MKRRAQQLWCTQGGRAANTITGRAIGAGNRAARSEPWASPTVTDEADDLSWPGRLQESLLRTSDIVSSATPQEPERKTR